MIDPIHDTPAASRPPEQVYEARLADRESEANRHRLRERWLERARVITFGGWAGLAALGWWGETTGRIPAAAATTMGVAAFAIFVVAIVAHARRRRARQRADRAASHYRERLARLRLEFAGRGDGGERFVEGRGDAHPYAHHLDIFGRGSVFERLAAARSESGKETLAGWLLEPADPGTVAARQRGVRALAPGMDLRERRHLLEEVPGEELGPEGVAVWAWPDDRMRLPRDRRIAAAFAVASASAAAAALLTPAGLLPLALVLLAQSGWAWSVGRPVRKLRGEVERPAKELRRAAQVLSLAAEGAPEAVLRGLLGPEGGSVEELVKRMSKPYRLMLRLDWMGNVMFAPLGAAVLWGTQHALAIEAWRRRHGRRVEEWLRAVGEWEALLDLSAYAFEHPGDAFPRFIGIEAAGAGEGERAGEPDEPVSPPDPGRALEPAAAGEAADGGGDGGGPAGDGKTGEAAGERRPEPRFVAEGLCHPLLAEAEGVRNDVALGGPGEPTALCVTGANMSGKSTLLRSVGVAAVMAQAGAPVRARTLRLTPLRVAASLRNEDSLIEARSHFYAELGAIRRIVEEARSGAPVLFLMDEVMGGTDSGDREIGAVGLLRELLEERAVGLLTTHDRRLGERLAEEFAPELVNVHLPWHWEEGELRFPYRLRPGLNPAANAVELMRSMGLDVERPEGVAGDVAGAPAAAGEGT